MSHVNCLPIVVCCSPFNLRNLTSISNLIIIICIIVDGLNKMKLFSVYL